MMGLVGGVEVTTNNEGGGSGERGNIWDEAILNKGINSMALVAEIQVY